MMALHNYEARSAEEIALKKGDIITVLSRDTTRGWWTGEVNGNIGKFPSSFCIFVEDSTKGQIQSTPQLKVKALYDFHARKESELTFNKGDVITVYKQHKSGWWTGQCNKQTGLFPNNYCTIVTEL
jgi:uncharacterized protein YgiM (DUF1202 family)